MPHGVRFRGGKEKLIREIFLEDDVMEAIIGLPPNLFYGTGIPACVFVCEQEQIGRIAGQSIFINADAQYAEGKNQNKLRPRGYRENRLRLHEQANWRAMPFSASSLMKSVSLATKASSIFRLNGALVNCSRLRTNTLH
jgi:type I restriction-modification system DNA methylase subunit